MSEELSPLAFRRKIRDTVVPGLEALANEYRNGSEQLRAALNQIFKAGNAAWPASLYELHQHLAGVNVTFAAWGVPTPSERDASNDTLARYYLVAMLQATATQNRAEFDRLTSEVADDAGVASKSSEIRVGFVSDILAKARHRDRDAIFERVREVAASVGMGVTFSLQDALANSGVHISHVLIDAFRDWHFFEAGGVRPCAGELQPLGYRTPVVELAPSQQELPQTDSALEEVDAEDRKGSVVEDTSVWSVPLRVTEWAVEVFDCSRNTAATRLVEMGANAIKQQNGQQWTINIAANPGYLVRYERFLRKKAMEKRTKDQLREDKKNEKDRLRAESRKSRSEGKTKSGTVS